MIDLVTMMKLLTTLLKLKIIELQAQKDTADMHLDVCKQALRELEFQRYLHTPCWRYKVNG